MTRAIVCFSLCLLAATNIATADTATYDFTVAAKFATGRAN
jgi:hypothetical protein